MSDSPWDSKLKAFLKKTGDDFKRAGAEMKQEAERLMAEAKDPERAKKIKEGLAEVSGWAKKTAEELAGYVDAGVKKAEVVLKDVVAKPLVPPSEKPTAPDASKVKPKVSAPRPAPTQETAVPAPTAKKTVGRGSKKNSPVKKASAKKPLGRAKSSK